MYNEKTSIFSRGARFTGFAFLGICAAVFFAALFAVVVKLLWNWLMPGIFGLGTITFMQAFGLILLARLLVGGWHSGYRHDNHRTKKHDHLHKFFEREFRGIPEEIRMNKKEFIKYWETEGRERFGSHIKKGNSENNKE